MDAMRYVRFQTDLFFTDMPDEQIGSWFLGGDCCGWFYARLLPLDGIEQNLHPTMEDWGWVMAVKANGIAVDICVWEHLGREKSWVLGIAAKKKWLRKTAPEALQQSQDLVAEAIGGILEADDRFSQIEWSTENPLEKAPEARQRWGPNKEIHANN